jgi:hypothetical protein
MPKIGKKSRVLYEDICNVVGLTMAAVKLAAKNKEFDPRDLKSIAYYIVKKTLQNPVLPL